MDNGQVIYNTLLNKNIPPALASLVVAQARHESNNFKSNVFQSCNNAFGYKYVGQAISTGSCNSVYAGYNSVQDSAIEIVNYLNRRVSEGSFPALKTITTPEQYASLLKDAGYYEDTVLNYTNGLKRWFISYQGAVITGGSLLLAGLTAYFLYKHSKNKKSKSFL